MKLEVIFKNSTQKKAAKQVPNKNQLKESKKEVIRA